MADFENNKQNETTDNSKDQLKQNLDHIQNEINQLTSNTDSSDDKIEGVDGMLTTAFADYLKKQDVKLVYALYNQVNDIIAKNKDNKDPNLQKLRNFLAPLADSAKMEGNMDDKLSDEEAKEYKGKVGRIENLQETKANLISSLEEKIKKLDGTDDNLKKTLSNIKAVVEQPNTVNVKSLQKFILKNLSGEAREKFFNYNFKAGPDGKKSSDNPDGFFGQNLVDGINTFLQGLDGYIAQVESSKNIQSENDEIAKKQAEQKKQEEARKLAEQKEKERVNSLNMSKIIDSEDGEMIKSLSSSIKNQIDDIIEIENSNDNDKNEKLGKKITKLDSKLKKEYMDLFVDKVKAKGKGKSVEEYDKQLKAILKFGSWKIRPEDGAIIDDTDNISDYRKYANKIGGNVILTEEKPKVPVEGEKKGENNGDKEKKQEASGVSVMKNETRGGDNKVDNVNEIKDGEININELNNEFAEFMRGIPDFWPENVSKLKIVKESGVGGEDHLVFKNGVHGVNINIDGILSDKNIFGEGVKDVDKMKLLFLASWQFCNGLTKIDSISYTKNSGGNAMLLHDGNRTIYIYYSRGGLDKGITEKFFSNYDKILSRFEKVTTYDANNNVLDNSEGTTSDNSDDTTDDVKSFTQGKQNYSENFNKSGLEGDETLNSLNLYLGEVLNKLDDDFCSNFNIDKKLIKIVEKVDGDDKNIVLSNGKFNININDVLKDGELCGKTDVKDKLGVVCLALQLRSQKIVDIEPEYEMGDEPYVKGFYKLDLYSNASSHDFNFYIEFDVFEKMGIHKDDGSINRFKEYYRKLIESKSFYES